LQAFSPHSRKHFVPATDGDVMADNDKSKIRYDDFVSNVQPDPAKPESTIMLSGFVGHGPEGHARVYPDPTLGTWYDIPEDDVVHSMPIPESRLGGSFIWVRASSEIKPGSAAAAATPALEAPQQAPHAAAAMMPTPATHCFICPPRTVFAPCTELCVTQQFHGCPPHPAIAAAQVGGGGGAPTPATQCLVCPLTVERGCMFTPPQTMCCPPTPMTECHPFCPLPPTPTPPHTTCCPHTPATNCPVCNVAPTPLTHCFICPPPFNHLPTQPPTLCCPPHTQPVALCGVVPQSGIVCSQACMNVQQAAAPAGGGFTPATICTLHAPCLPPPTPATTCPVCPPHPPTPQTLCRPFCDAGLASAVCPPTPDCPPTPITLCPFCTHQVACVVGQTASNDCANAPQLRPNTAATVCTQPLGCTFAGCTMPGHCMPTQWFVCQTPRCGIFTPFCPQ
jgi:hypothetical protein